MRGGPSAWARVRRLEGRGHDREVRRAAEEVAAALGIGVDEVLRGAQELADWMAEAGATTDDQRWRMLAAELGVDPAELRAEVAAMLGRDT